MIPHEYSINVLCSLCGGLVWLYVCVLDLASAEKKRLEEKQRMSRKNRSKSSEEWKTRLVIEQCHLLLERHLLCIKASATARSALLIASPICLVLSAMLSPFVVIEKEPCAWLKVWLVLSVLVCFAVCLLSWFGLHVLHYTTTLRTTGTTAFVLW